MSIFESRQGCVRTSTTILRLGARNRHGSGRSRMQWGGVTNQPGLTRGVPGDLPSESLRWELTRRSRRQLNEILTTASHLQRRNPWLAQLRTGLVRMLNLTRPPVTISTSLLYSTVHVQSHSTSTPNASNSSASRGPAAVPISRCQRGINGTIQLFNTRFIRWLSASLGRISPPAFDIPS
jgi:hypothetical protein